MASNYDYLRPQPLPSTSELPSASASPANFQPPKSRSKRAAAAALAPAQQPGQQQPRTRSQSAQTKGQCSSPAEQQELPQFGPQQKHPHGQAFANIQPRPQPQQHTGDPQLPPEYHEATFQEDPIQAGHPKSESQVQHPMPAVQPQQQQQQQQQQYQHQIQYQPQTASQSIQQTPRQRAQFQLLPHPQFQQQQQQQPHNAPQSQLPHPQQQQQQPSPAPPPHTPQTSQNPAAQQPSSSAPSPYVPRPSLFLGPYDTREEAFASAQEYAVVQGYCLVNQGSAKAKSANGLYDPHASVVRVDLMCDRGRISVPTSKGIRKRTSTRTGCPCRMKLVYSITRGHKWYITIRNEEHNHELTPGKMEENTSYRRYRRIQMGGNRLETPRERYLRLTKDKVKAPSVPAPPTWHTPGVVQPAAPPASASATVPASTSTSTSTPATPTKLTSTNPLHLAALRGQDKIVTILLNKGADINAADSAGQTPLHCAIQGGKMEVINHLISRGADVSLKDANGLSVLHAAVNSGLEDVVVMLIEHGADPNL